MKINPRVIALILSGSLMFSAGCNIVHETEVSSDTSETATSEAETSETTEATTTEATTATEATTTEPTTTEATTTTEESEEDEEDETKSTTAFAKESDGLPDSGRAKENRSYELFMSFVEGFEKDNPGSTYGIYKDFDEKVDDPFWVLLVLSSDSSRKAYCADGDKVIEYDTGYWEQITVPNKMLDYKTFKSLPCLFEVTDSYLSIDKSIKDGYYFGDNIAFSEDGKSFLFTYGIGSYIKTSDAKKLKAGDKVTFEGSGETFTVDEGTSGLDATFEDQEFWLDDLYPDDPRGGEYMMLRGASDIPEYKVLGMAILPITEDVEIRDGYNSYFSEDKIKEYRDTNGKSDNQFLDSAYYIGTCTEYEFTMRSNGFVSGEAQLYPIVVKDGKLVKISLSWT